MITQNFLKKKYFYNSICFATLFLLFIFLFILSFSPPNTYPHLHIDEFLIFRGVFYILHPDSFSGFINAIINGGFRGIDSFINKLSNNTTEPGLYFNAHYYGRFTLYASALVSFIPELFYGDRGQIISTRIFLGLIFLSVCANAMIIISSPFLIR